MLNSVNTNAGAMVALRNLTRTGESLARAQDRVSTGLKVIGAKDDASNFAIAQGIRADLKGYKAVEQALASAKGVGDVAIAAVTSISNVAQEMKRKCIEAMNEANTASQQQILAADFENLRNQMISIFKNATYNGKNLIDTGTTDHTVISALDGSTLTISCWSSIAPLSPVINPVTTPALAAGALPAINALMDITGKVLGTMGAQVKAIEAQIRFNQIASDATTEGLGSLVDADLAQESAVLQSLQVKQQLGVQSLSIANAAPGILLSLFR